MTRMKFWKWILGWILLCPGASPAAAAPSLELNRALEAETRQDWATALLEYERVYDSTRTTADTRSLLRNKFAELRSKVAPNQDSAKAGVWKVRAYAFRELDFTWDGKDGKSHRAQYRYREEEIDRLRKGMEGFAARVWVFSSGNLRIDWELKLIEKPLSRLDGEESFWPGPDACMPYLTDLQPGQADTIMVFAKVFGDPVKDQPSAEVPQMLLGGAIGVANPLTKGATYIAFNWGTGTAANEPDGEPMLHEWLHSAQWALEEHQGYPPGLMCSSDGGRMEGEEGGDPCYRRQPSETSWMKFYQHIMRNHVTRRMWRELSPNRPPTNIWLQVQPMGPYIDPAQMDCPWPKMSHYKQPWRGYMETRSGRDFLQGLGVNLHIPGDRDELAIRLLAETGFRTFRIEIGWGEMSWEETKLNHEDRFRKRLELCAKYGIRPTLLINAHQGVPCPVRFYKRRLLKAAGKGERTLHLDNVKDLVIGRSGLSGLSDYWAAEALITQINPDAGEVLLSKPLPKELPAGEVEMATLKYLPLYPAGTPEFEETAGGWVRHALHVCELAKGAGIQDFDIEVWNELTFGTHFLNINDYYDPAAPKVTREQPDFLRAGGRCWELARKTALAIKQAHPRVRVIWGFSNTTFYHCPIEDLPPGIDGQSYHPYGTGTREFTGRQERSDQPPLENFVPSYTLRMSEGWAPTFIQTECLIRLLRPGVRLAKASPGTSGFYHYITEHGVLPPECGIKDEAGAWRLKALCAARSFCLWLNKGIDALHYFDAYEENPASFGVLPANLRQLPPDSKFEEVATPPMRAVRNLAKAFSGSVPLHKTDALQIEVTPLGPQLTVFEGNATHPPLWEREVLAVLPFQLNPDRHAIAVYVMTRDVTETFAPAPFQFKLSGVKGKEVEAIDILGDETPLLRTRDLGGSDLELRLYVTDKPVVLRIGR
jgi:hypothetical protein